MICLDITEVKKMNNFDERYDERHNEKANNVLGALSYLSVFFAPVLFPLVVWIIAKPQVLLILEMLYLIIFSLGYL